MAVAAALSASGGALAAESGARDCMFMGDPDGQLDRVSDCMRMGRHVRVETSVSRGTATLGDTTSTGVQDRAQHRVRVPMDPLGSFSGFPSR